MCSTAPVTSGESTYTLELPYRRSLGPVVGAFLTGLRDQRVLGSRTADGRVLVPALEYDPATGDAVDDLVEVGTAGTVTAWAWVHEPMRNHPLDHPFAWVLVQLDGADTSIAPRARRAERLRRHRHAGAHPLGRRTARAHHRHRLLRAGGGRVSERERRRERRRRRPRPVHAAAHRPRLRRAGEPAGAALRRAAPIRAHRGPAVPVVRPRVRAATVVLPAVRRRHGPRGGGGARRHGHRHRLHGAHPDPVPRPEGAGRLRARQRADRRRQRHRRPAAAHRRPPRPDPHRPAGRGGVGRPRRSVGAIPAIGATPSPTPSGVGAPPASPTSPPRPSRSTCSDDARRRHRLVRAGAVRGTASRRRSRSCSSRSSTRPSPARASIDGRSASPAPAAPTTSPARRSRSSATSRPPAPGRPSRRATWRWTVRGRSTRRGCGSSTATSTRRSCSPPGSPRAASCARSSASRTIPTT